MTTIAANLQAVRRRIAAACAAAGRDVAQVRLLAVTKTFPAQAVRDALACGQPEFGENYIQEALAKMDAVGSIGSMDDGAAVGAVRPVWHCIGPIQSNKTRQVAEHFDWAQSIDRLKIAQRLSAQRPAHLAPLQVCIQVNTDGGPTKAGVAPDALPELARAIRQLPRLQLRGLMTIPEPAADFAAALALHERACALFEQLNADGHALDTLSMGMSADLEAAIHAGSTMVRIGSAIFGARAASPI